MVTEVIFIILIVIILIYEYQSLSEHTRKEKNIKDCIKACRSGLLRGSIASAITTGGNPALIVTGGLTFGTVSTISYLIDY